MALSHRRLVLLGGGGSSAVAAPLRKPCPPPSLRSATASRIPITKSPGRKASSVSPACSASVPRDASPLNDLSWKFSADPASTATPGGRGGHPPPIRPKSASVRRAGASAARGVQRKAPRLAPSTSSSTTSTRSEEEAIQDLQELVRRQQEELEQYRDTNTPFLLSSSLVKQVAAQGRIQPERSRDASPGEASQDLDTGKRQDADQDTNQEYDVGQNQNLTRSHSYEAVNHEDLSQKGGPVQVHDKACVQEDSQHFGEGQTQNLIRESSPELIQDVSEAITELSIEIPTEPVESYSVQVDEMRYDGPLQVKSLPQPRLEDRETSMDVLEDPRLTATRNRLNQRLQHLLDGQAKENVAPQVPQMSFTTPGPGADESDGDQVSHAPSPKEQYHQEIRELLQKLHGEAGYDYRVNVEPEPIYAVSSKCRASPYSVEKKQLELLLNAPLEQNVQQTAPSVDLRHDQRLGDMSSSTATAQDSDRESLESSSDGTSGSGDDGIGEERSRRQRASRRIPPDSARDLSMDSGIQGSSCDLDGAADSSSASDALEDDEFLSRKGSESLGLGSLPAGGEAFKAVEELYVAGGVPAEAEGVPRLFTETHFDSAPDLASLESSGAAAGPTFHSTPVISSFFRNTSGNLAATSWGGVDDLSSITNGSSIVSLPNVATQCAQQAGSLLSLPVPLAGPPPQHPEHPEPPEPFRRAHPSKRFSSADDVFRASLLRHSLPAKPPRTPSVRTSSENGLAGSIRHLGEESSAEPAPAAPAQQGAVLSASRSGTDPSTGPTPIQTHQVVVAIDFGTTYSGYAFSYTRDPESHIHMMRKWEGGDPGLHNEKAPTALLLTPDGKFHSFGFLARDTFHDLHPDHAKRWLFFDKFKMALLSQTTLSRDTPLAAANGRLVPALTVLSLSLLHLRERALAEIAAADQAGPGPAGQLGQLAVRWVLTVPALWGPPATQLLREAAHQAGLASPERPEDLLIVLEPEAASLCCRQLRLHQLLHAQPAQHAAGAMASLVLDPDGEGAGMQTQYMVVDCGGGTVDITVHELTGQRSCLRELHKASGGACGSLGVDREFERLLCAVFGADFMSQFRRKRPAAYVELLLAFEARKRSADPDRDAGAALSIFPPFAFIEAYRKFRGKEVEHAVRKFGRPSEVTWSSQGMLRLSPKLMADLFRPTLDHICALIEEVLRSPRLRGRIQYMFLVGGFSQSLVLQQRVRRQFGERVRVVVPQGVGLTTLRGAVLFGLDPGLVVSRRSKHTIGVGVLKRFQPGEHPQDKLVRLSDGTSWCCDVLDVLVLADQQLGPGEAVTRSYTPASARQTNIIIHIYCCSDSAPPKFVTDPGVSRCGTLRLSLAALDPSEASVTNKAARSREIVATIEFGGTELAASALDISSGRCVRTQLDFLSTAV